MSCNIGRGRCRDDAESIRKLSVERVGKAVRGSCHARECTRGKSAIERYLVEHGKALALLSEDHHCSGSAAKVDVILDVVPAIRVEGWHGEPQAIGCAGNRAGGQSVSERSP